MPRSFIIVDLPRLSLHLLDITPQKMFVFLEELRSQTVLISDVVK